MAEIKNIVELNSSIDKEEFDEYYNMWLSGDSKVNKNVQSQYMNYISHDDSATQTKTISIEEYENELVNILSEFNSFLSDPKQISTEVQDFLNTKIYNFIVNSRDILNDFVSAKNEFDKGIEDTSTINKIKYLRLLMPFDIIIANRNQIFNGENLFEMLTKFIEHLTDIKGQNDKYLFEISNDKFTLNELYEEKLRQYNEFIEDSKDIIYDESRYNNIR